MEEKKQELVFIKPTIFFYDLLQANNFCCRNIKKNHMNIDKTAYFIKKCSQVEYSVDEIEKHYKSIFLYEIRRWLGKSFRFNFEPSLYDFANCFYLECHQNVYLVKTNNQKSHLIGLDIKPRQDLFKWFKTNTNIDSSYQMKITLSSMQENSSVVLTRQENLDDTFIFVMNYFKNFAEFENKRLSLSCFPKINSLDDFKRFFTLSIHQYIKFLEPELKSII